MLLFVHCHFFHQNSHLSRRTHIDEVIADDTEDSESKYMMAMFALPPVALPRPRPRPRVQEVPRPSSAATLLLPNMGAGTTRGARRHQVLGGFVWDTPERMGIRDSARATAIIGILQLAASHPQG